MTGFFEFNAAILLILQLLDVVVGVPHKDLGEAPVAVVCLDRVQPFDEEKMERDIVDALKEVLVKYKVGTFADFHL